MNGYAIAAALALLPPAVLAQDALSPDEVVKARQAAFGLSAGTFGEMKMVADAGGDVRPLMFGARMLQRWARTIPTMFPEGSNVAPTRAKAELWSDRAGFEARAAAYAEAAGRLAQAAQSGEREAFLTAWEATRETCNACHEGFRNEPQRPGP